MPRKPKHAGGAPSQLNEEVTLLILAGLQTGAPLAAAASNAKIPEGTVWRWMSEGKQNPDSPQGKFRRRVRLARAEAELRFASIIAIGATKDDAKWMLTHRYPKGWADRSKQETKLSGKVEVTDGGRERLAAILARFTKPGGSGSGDRGAS